ncbi:hypothetical protein PR048_026385 [Dryococelus australis]|uniref:Armadillo repeat-containing protein 6 n=1 Tax=Dryococelus australis TaxID=614101 RepID=A0ABQ9GL94_9NEOP|nr:hypothetical protein PR048_026385 [Dryococelus australis]
MTVAASLNKEISELHDFIFQGVDLSNIVKDALNNLSSSSTQELMQALLSVATLQKDLSTEEELVRALDALQLEVDKSLAHKVHAGKNRCYDILLNSLEGADPNINVLMCAAKSLTSLMTGQPDLLNARGIDAMFKNLTETVPSSVHAEVLRWAMQCCVKHEGNRQNLMKRGITKHLKQLLRSDMALSSAIKGACGLIRALVLDDDVRVEFGLAHDHAKELASEILCTLVDLAKSESLV